ncbi:MAG: ATP-grasp domain-containing protein [Promethearchaeota archaeon]
MKIGILSKRNKMFASKIKRYLESEGHIVELFTLENLSINQSLLKNDFFILKSKHMFFLYAGYFLEGNNIHVIPNVNLSYKHKNRIEAHYLIKQAGLLGPNVFMGTVDILKAKLKNNDYPFIQKPLMGSGSRGVRLIKSSDDLKSNDGSPIYLEKYIHGIHYLSYFIDEKVCVYEKIPLSNEHAQVKAIEMTQDLKDITLQWKDYYHMLFGHLDIVRDQKTNKLYVVDPGSFPEFSNWNCSVDPVKEVCQLILNEYINLKN